jgi:hypothetical protein
MIKGLAAPGESSGQDDAVIWMACDRQRRVHAVPADVHSPAYRAHGLIEAVCGVTVYPLHVAEAGARRCKHCTEKLLPRTSSDVR